MDCPKLPGKAACPVLEHFKNWHAVLDRKGEVEIRPTIPLVARERTNDGSGHYTRVSRRHFKYTVLNSFAFIHAEHTAP